MIDWRHWHNEPYLVGGLVFLGWLYALLAGPLRARLSPGSAFPRGHVLRFYGALVIFYLAVGSPLDQIGERYLFSAHMLQHQLLIYPAAILFLLGIPSWMIDPVLSRPELRGSLRLLTRPLICGLLYSLIISLWHVPWAYDLALQNKTVHIVEHIMFFIGGLLYWWPLLSPSRVFPPIAYGAQMLYALGVVIAMTPVFAFITFSQDILYPTYEFAPRLFPDFTAGEDQLLAGVSMKLVGLAVALGGFGVSFYKWMESDRAKK